MKCYNKIKYNYDLFICLMEDEIHHLIREELTWIWWYATFVMLIHFGWNHIGYFCCDKNNTSEYYFK